MFVLHFANFRSRVRRARSSSSLMCAFRLFHWKLKMTFQFHLCGQNGVRGHASGRKGSCKSLRTSVPLWSARLRSTSTNVLAAISAGISPELEPPTRTASSRPAANPRGGQADSLACTTAKFWRIDAKHAAGKMSTHVRVNHWHKTVATKELVGTNRGDRMPALEMRDPFPNNIESCETRTSVLKIKHPAACRCLQPAQADAWLREPRREGNVVQDFSKRWCSTAIDTINHAAHSDSHSFAGGSSSFALGTSRLSSASLYTAWDRDSAWMTSPRIDWQFHRCRNYRHKFSTTSAWNNPTLQERVPLEWALSLGRAHPCYAVRWKWFFYIDVESHPLQTTSPSEQQLMSTRLDAYSKKQWVQMDFPHCSHGFCLPAHHHFHFWWRFESAWMKLSTCAMRAETRTRGVPRFSTPKAPTNTGSPSTTGASSRAISTTTPRSSSVACTRAGWTPTRWDSGRRTRFGSISASRTSPVARVSGPTIPTVPAGGRPGMISSDVNGCGRETSSPV